MTAISGIKQEHALPARESQSPPEGRGQPRDEAPSFFVDKFAKAKGETLKSLTKKADDSPRSKQWPGGTDVEAFDLGLGVKTSKNYVGSLETKKGTVDLYSVYDKDMKNPLGVLRIRHATGEYRFTATPKLSK